MALNTYAALQTAILTTLNRPELTTDVVDWITLAEATIRRRLRRSTTRGTLTFVTGNFSKALPATVSEVRSLAPQASLSAGSMTIGGPPLARGTMDQVQEIWSQHKTTGLPRVYAVVDGSVYLAPAPSDLYLVYDLVSYDALVSVSSDTALLVEAPDLYLYGACLESAPFLQHDERIPVWQDRFDRAIAELNEKRQNEEFGASLSRPRLPMNFG